ncbi:phosphoribosylformylglycinamidine synthase, putative, partial [Streptococcus agalactiae COH1]
MNQMGLLSVSTVSCLTRRFAQLLTASSKKVALSSESVMVSKPLINQVFFHTETSRKLVRQVQPSSITMPTQHV